MTKTKLAWILAAVWIGCTSTTTPGVSPGDAGADVKDGGKTGDGGTVDPGTDGGKTDGGKTDSGTDEDSGGPTPLGPCTAISGGLPCDTGKIYCGATTCDQATQECCVDVTTGAATCTNIGSCSNAPMACDEARDCAAGEVCCFSASGTTPTGAQCTPGSCSGLGEFAQSCRSDDECSISGECIPQQCKTYKIQTCAQIPQDPCP